MPSSSPMLDPELIGRFTVAEIEQIQSVQRETVAEFRKWLFEN